MCKGLCGSATSPETTLFSHSSLSVSLTNERAERSHVVCSDAFSLYVNESNQFTNSTADMLTVDSAHRVPPDPAGAETVKVSLHYKVAILRSRLKIQLPHTDGTLSKGRDFTAMK